MGKMLSDNSIFKMAHSLKKWIYQMMQKEWKNFLPTPSLSAQFQVVILYFAFAAPFEQLYTDTFLLVFLKFLSLLPDPPDPSKIKSSLNGKKLPWDFVQSENLGSSRRRNTPWHLSFMAKTWNPWGPVPLAV